MDTRESSATRRTNQERDELLRAACEAMRLLQDRQRHLPPEMMVDNRETRVLKLLRDAIRGQV